MKCGVPQGSILGLLLLNLFMLPLGLIMQKNKVGYHIYEDDTELYIALSPRSMTKSVTGCATISSN